MNTPADDIYTRVSKATSTDRQFVKTVCFTLMYSSCIIQTEKELEEAMIATVEMYKRMT